MSKSYSVSLAGPAPWGFRLQGGAEHERPVQVAKVPVECVVLLWSEGPVMLCVRVYVFVGVVKPGLAL